MRSVLRATGLGCLIYLLIGPLSARADDWEQLPSNRGAQSEVPEPANGDDAQAIANFFAQIKSSPSENLKGCEAIGMFADMMAIARDQGVSQDDLLRRIGSGFKEKAAERNVPMKWVQPIEAVVERQVSYVYAHPGMEASQVQTEWNDMCRAQAARE